MRQIAVSINSLVILTVCVVAFLGSNLITYTAFPRYVTQTSTVTTPTTKTSTTTSSITTTYYATVTQTMVSTWTEYIYGAYWQNPYDWWQMTTRYTYTTHTRNTRTWNTHTWSSRTQATSTWSAHTYSTHTWSSHTQATSTWSSRTRHQEPIGDYTGFNWTIYGQN